MTMQETQKSCKLWVAYKYDWLREQFAYIVKIIYILSLIDGLLFSYKLLILLPGNFFNKLIYLLYNHDFHMRLLLLVGVNLIFRITIHYLHKYIGIWLELRAGEDQSRKIAYYVLPNALLVLGARRSGKDVLSTWYGNICSLYVKIDMRLEMDNLSQFLYMFDLEQLKEYVSANSALFISASERLRKKELFKLLKTTDYIITWYHAYFNITDLLIDYANFLDENNFKNTKEVVSDSINTTHLLDCLYKYLYDHYRLEVVKVIVIANQPIVDLENNPTLIFSQEFKRFKNHNKVENLSIPGETRKIAHNYITKLPLEDNMISLQTEQDINKSNVDKNVTQEIKASGERVFDAIRGHIAGENYREVKNGQVRGRENKLTRDLNEAEIKIIRKLVIVEGGPVRRYFLEKKVKRLNKKIKRCKKDCKKKHDLILRKLSSINKIEKLKKDGYLRLETIISSTEYFGEAQQITKRKLLEHNQRLFIEAFKIEFVMRMRDTWGHNNTHYLKELSDKLKEESEISINSIPRWGRKLVLTKDNIIDLDNKVMDDFANIDLTETIGKRLRKK